MPSIRSFGLAVSIGLLAPIALKAEVTTWQLGGSQPWAGQDTVSIMIDFERVLGAIQPVRVEPGVNIISLLNNWTTFRQPKELGYIDGERPRIWKWNEGNGDPTENGVALIDADSTTYNSSKAEGIDKQFFTIDLAVPMPAHTFGFHTPSSGFRSDGTPLPTDSTPAFQVSIQEENSEIFAVKGPQPLARIVAAPTENFAPDVHIGFDQQYVRFFRWARKFSIIDETALTRVSGTSGGQGNQARSLLGTISEFEVYGKGFPKRATYRSKIIDLGAEQNFGRLFFAATPMRVVAGEAVEAPDARAFVEVEVRTGRDDDPNIYHEYTVTGKEKVVSRARYETDLRTGFARTCASCDFVQRSPRPGMRAGVTYDSDNWTFWSTPTTQAGLPLNLESGSFIQVFITFHSTRFEDFVRLDSLWGRAGTAVGGARPRRSGPARRPAARARLRGGRLGRNGRVCVRPVGLLLRGESARLRPSAYPHGCPARVQRTARQRPSSRPSHRPRRGRRANGDPAGTRHARQQRAVAHRLCSGGF